MRIKKEENRMATFAYVDPIARGLLCAWKYEGSVEARDILFARAKPSWETVHEWMRIEGAEAIVPVPLHPWKKRMRGFDQAEDVAKQLIMGSDLDFSTFLRRIHFTDPQAQKKEEDRKRSMEGETFVATQSCPRTVCLVDDVWTTGATCEAAARALKKAGAEKVIVYTLFEG